MAANYPGNARRRAKPEPVDHFAYLWKWFEIHISHRTNMLNFLLVASGILAVGYVNLMTTEYEPRLAAWLALAGSIVSVCFYALDIITLRKIQHAKSLMRTVVKEQGPVNDLLRGLDPERKGFVASRLGIGRDPFWTTMIEATLASGFLAAALYSFDIQGCSRCLLPIGLVVLQFMIAFQQNRK